MPQPSIARIEAGAVVPRTATLMQLLAATGHQLAVEPIGPAVETEEIERRLGMTVPVRVHRAIGRAASKDPLTSPFRVLRRLRRFNVPFVLIGAVAEAAHGAPVKAGWPVEVCHATTDVGLERLDMAVKDLGPLAEKRRLRLVTQTAAGDDFDAEFRYSGRPLRALQGMDADGRVIYVGTFSKVLIPSLRLAYMVVPPPLVDVFVSARVVAGMHAPSVDQAVLADFIDGGHFTRHIRRTRTLYHERQEALVAAAAQELDSVLEVPPSDAGMHLIGWLRGPLSEHTASARAAAADVIVQPLSSFALAAQPRKGLVLGYSGIRPSLIWRGARVLGEVLRKASDGSVGAAVH